MQEEINKIRGASNFNKLRFLAKDSALYGGIKALSKFVAVFLTPLLTRYLDKEAFGTYDAMMVLNALFVVIIVFGVDSALARFYYEKDDESYRKELALNALIVNIVFSGIICLIVYFNASAICNFYLGSDKYVHLLQITCYTVIFIGLFRFGQNLLKWTFSRTKYLMVSTGLIVSIFLFTYLFMVTFKFGVEGALYGQLTAYVVFGLLSVLFCLKHIGGSLSIQMMLRMLGYGWPYMFSALLPTLMPSLDRYFIAEYLSVSAIAIYALAIKIGSILQVPFMSVHTAFGPFMFATFKEKDSNRLYNQITKGVVFVLVLCSIIIICFSKPLILLFANEGYLESRSLFVFVLFGLVLDFSSRLMSTGIELSKKTYYIAITQFIGVVLTIVFLYYFTPRMGLLGAALAVCSVRFIMAVLRVYFAHIAYPFKYQYIRVLILIGLGAFLSQLAMNWSEQYHVVLIALGCIVTYGLFTWLILLSTPERKSTLAFVKRKMIR